MSPTGVESLSSIKGKMISGAVWMVLLKFCSRFIGLISTAILARILVPEDYGLVAMATSAYALIEIMASFGFDVVLIRNDKATEADFNSAWTVRLVCYSVLSGLLYLVGPLIADFYGQPQVELIVSILALAMFISAFENIAVVKFRKELQFKKEFYFQLWVKLAGFVITVPLAMVLKNHWALVAGIVTTKLAAVSFGYVLIPYKPRLTFEKAGDIFNFSKWLLASNFLKYVEMRSPDLVLGKLLGASALGVYSHAAELARTTNAEIVAPINRALFPGYSKMKSDPEALAASFLNVVGLLAVFILPIGAGIALTSEYVVAILLGDKWLGVVAPLSILSLGYAFAALMSNAHYIYFVFDKPRLMTVIMFVKVSVLVPGILWAANEHGIMGVAIVYTLVNVAVPSIHMVTTKGMLHIGLRQYVSVFYRPMTACAAMYAGVYSAKPFLVANAGNMMLMELLLHVLLGGGIYALVLLVLWKLAGSPESGEAQAINRVMAKIRG